MTDTRRAAVFILCRWALTREFPAELLPNGPERGFVQDLVYTVLRHLRALRKVLGVLVPKWPKGELEKLLYVGAAQILYMDEVPDYAAVSATVEAAKRGTKPQNAKVVNGVLRNLLRRREELMAMLAESPLEDRESFPTALVRRWSAHFGAEGAARLCGWHNRPADTYLARPDGSFVMLGHGQAVTAVDGYERGEFIVQDPGTALAVRLLAPQPGEAVLDACAAPGGKTAQLAWRGARVTACEVNPRRRHRLEENLKRLRLEASVTVVDSLDAPTLPAGGFAKVLVDAPCSNTGVMRRRPDARWNWSEAKLAELVRLQAAILDRAARLVAPGGTLVYSTCSNEPEENLRQVRALLARHPEFSLCAFDEAVPFAAGHDGAFAAAMIRAEGRD